MALKYYETDTLTCLYRDGGSSARIDNYYFDFALYRDNLTSTYYVTANWVNSISTEISNAIVVIVDGTYYTLGTLSGWSDPVLKFTTNGSMPAISLYRRMASDDLYYGGIRNEPININYTKYSTLPNINFAPVVYANHTNNLTWTLTPGDSRVGKVVGIHAYLKASGASNYTETTLFSDTAKTSYAYTLNASAEGCSVYFVVEYRTYSNSSASLDNFITCNKYTTPVSTVLHYNTAPTVPSSITVPSKILGGTTINISWGASTDADGNFSKYILECSTNGGSWTQIYSGTALTTTNTVVFGTASVTYRVKAMDTDGASSAYKTSNTITIFNNTAPTVPSGITVPSVIGKEKQIPVSWTAATDADGNLYGYILECSINGGNWTQIYNGPELTYAHYLPETIAYRVKAVDNEGYESDYVTSSVVTIDNNTASNIYIGINGVWEKASSISVGTL